MFDVVGVLSLVALTVGLGFLTTRAWRLRNAVLKWIGSLLASVLTVIPAALLVFALVGFYKLNARYANPAADIKVAGTPEQIARGQQLAHVCTGCHSATKDFQLPLAGVDVATRYDMSFLGTFYGPNLTPAGNIQDWTDGEVIRAIREGIHKDGRSLLLMPANVGRNLSDDDVQALVAYLRSQPATGAPTPATNLSVLGAIFINLFDLRTAQPPVGSVTALPTGTPAYGKYMVDILGCRDCHGAQLQGKVDNGQPGPPPGPNLTRIVPGWTEDQFMTFFNTGRRPDGSPVPTLTLASGFTEPRMPWNEFRAAVTDAELHDMYTYLHALAPVESPQP